MTPSPADWPALALRWLDMKGFTKESLCGTNEVGVWYNLDSGTTRLAEWENVLADLAGVES